MDIKDLTYRDIEGTDDFVEVVDVNFGGGYEWDEFHGWYSPSKRRYFWTSGSGCSCNSLGDDIYKISDLSDGAKADLERALRAYLEYSYPYPAHPSDALRAVAQVKQFRPSDHKNGEK